MPHISKRSHEGLLIIDHSESPGVTPEDVNGMGPIVGKGQTFEAPIVQCCHCNVGVILNPLRNRPRNYCQKCDAYVCDQAGCLTNCLPFEKVVDRALELGAKGLPAGGTIWIP
jgi:hypothetical protein